MKTLATLLFVFLIYGASAQTEVSPCNELPVAVPETKAVCLTSDLESYFSGVVSENQKKGEFSAVYKLYVDCTGLVKMAAYQRGTFSEKDQRAFQEAILRLKWTAAKEKGQSVTSVVFISFSLVNGQCTVTVQ